MRCLWLTRTDPFPGDTGELIYSGKMIESFAQGGADITVLCLARPEAGDAAEYGGPDVQWKRVRGAPRPAWQSMFSALPNLACRCAVPSLRHGLSEMLAARPWDLVVLDSLSVCWALPAVLSSTASGGRRPRLVYVSHNHEETTRARVATSYRGNPLKRLAMLTDARKAGLLERHVVRAADLVTAITLADRTLYAAVRDGRPTITLPPGYDGRRVENRHITADTPRRVVMVGSYEWVAKQVNLRNFARAAAGDFDRNGAELVVVGNGGSFLDGLRREFPSVTFTGRVDDVYPYMDDARMAVVPEMLGGGFKLKTLDYVFNRLPIAALDRACEGAPLTDRDSLLSFPDVGRLVDGILDTIDDLPKLNHLQERAYAACAGRFDWSTRGRTLFDAVETL
jgi:glycosyltransferase involved in cell wall biosynthesis